MNSMRCSYNICAGTADVKNHVIIIGSLGFYFQANIIDKTGETILCQDVFWDRN